MKKYLLMGFVALAFASCVSDKEVTSQTQDQKYQAAFEATFGKVAASVNWGFNDMTAINFNEKGEYTGMRGVDANGNQWGMYVDVPEPLTEAQIAKVTKYFTETENPQGVAVNWSDFFVQQVSSTEHGPHMNYLYCGSGEDHTYNFNAGDAGTYDNVCYGLNEGATDQNDRKYGSDKIEFMVNSSTEYFAFHNSYDSKFYTDNYVIIPGEVIDAAISDGPSVAGMWFVGFDYEHDKTDSGDNDVLQRDYYFNDWIVKITPGLYKDRERVFAEDLITSDMENLGYTDGKSDWDFNDAVFDVNFIQDWSANKKYAVITLWAAGGTKALTIAGKEVHELFGVSQNVMVNTGDGATATPVIFRVEVGSDVNNANDIAVKVGGYTLTAVQGAATQKLCAPATVDWVGERVAIWTVFPGFKDYVAGNRSTWY